MGDEEVGSEHQLLGIKAMLWELKSDNLLYFNI